MDDSQQPERNGESQEKLILGAPPETKEGQPSEQNRRQVPLPDAAGKAILLVDDDDNVLKVLGEQLRELGFKVEEVGDGKSAIELLKSNGSYDVLLTDFAMPGMNGLDTIRRAVRERPSLQTLLMTGFADESSVADARQNVPIIRKPINLEELMREIA